MDCPLTFSASERGDSNARPLRPERSALPTALLSEYACKVTAFFRKEQVYGVFSIKNLRNQKRKTNFAAEFRKNGAIAQLVEHRTENPCVPGSNPGGTTPKNKMPRSKLHGTGFFMATHRISRQKPKIWQEMLNFTIGKQTIHVRKRSNDTTGTQCAGP